jgi:hypothetical protein
VYYLFCSTTNLNLKGTKMQAITKYQTTDGKEFNSEAEGSAHQAALDNKGRIDAFLDKNYPVKVGGGKCGPARAIAGKAVAQWLSEQV